MVNVRKFILMKIMQSVTASLLALFLTLPHNAFAGEFDAGRYTLIELIESAKENALANRIAQTKLEVMRQQLAALNANSGVKLVASGGWDLNQTVISTNSTLTYQTLGAGVGIQVPLLGAAEKQQSAIRSARLSVDKSLENWRANQRMVISLVLKANAELYFSLQRVALASAFLRSEGDARIILLQRTRAHLLLQSDQLDFLSAFDTVRTAMRAQQMNVTILRALLSQLTAKNLANYIPGRPLLSDQLDRINVSECINQSPIVKVAQAELHSNREATKQSRWEGVNAYLSLSEQFNKGIGVPSGGATGINLSLDMPLDILALRRATRDATQMETLEAQLKLQQAKQDGLRKLGLAQATWVERRGALQAWDRQLQAAFAAWDIAYKRIQVLPGDTLEKLLQARYRLYQAALNRINAQESATLAAIDYAAPCGWKTLALTETVPTVSYTMASKEAFDGYSGSVNQAVSSFNAHPFSATLAALSLSLPTTESTNWNLGWYVWATQSLLTHPQDLSQFPPRTRVLDLSFTKTQLEHLESSLAAQRELRQFLQAAHKRRLSIIWLIGDPSLVLPEGRDFLRAWIPVMQKFDFDGIDIDAEQEQLPINIRPIWVEGMLRTLNLIRQQTDWPVSLTVNWRSLAMPGFKNKIAISGLSSINVMLYVRNQDRTVNIMRKLLTTDSDLPLTLAQSVESDINPQDSLACLGPSGALKQLSNINSKLRIYANYMGIMVQSWGAFKQLRPSESGCKN
ncbi:MAG: TolC family protein [Acidithiobacillus sp.]|nr:TolC family protein [Acidithiobacillus sp.]